MKNSTQNNKTDLKRRQSRRMAEKVESTQQQTRAVNPFAIPVTEEMRELVWFKLPASFDMPLENLNPWVMKEFKKWERRRPAPEEESVKMEADGSMDQPGVSAEKVAEKVLEKEDMDMKEEKEVRVDPPVRLEEITQENVKELKSVIESTMTNLFEDESYEGAIALKEHGRLAFLDGVPVGYVMTELYENRKVLVTSIGVPFAHRKCGVGSVLMKHVQSLCEQLGQVKKLSLYIQPTNARGIRFFESHGLKRKELLRNYYSGEPREAWRMTRRIRK
ncbi:hypothetical protein GCK72_013019 [Caenorhabditis remanei]|uniref:N-terminal methionine N(alpha)-acetyltransferase NatE n=1 Tax=Caenorhabditis remanei TaxID=31234 RepID=A0A6A5GPW1_CAERE|nr:hypothetical protein GCK72_013019 [Caenorhabditis remanei]KAF1756566.1 hypothetical protein GCK72_013019 [Caenorhabditis remanei]